MPEVISNTSPLQYLYQLDLLSVLQTLAARIIVPPVVVQEPAVGRAQGVRLPDLTVLEWVTVRQPISAPALPLIRVALKIPCYASGNDACGILSAGNRRERMLPDGGSW